MLYDLFRKDVLNKAQTKKKKVENCYYQYIKNLKILFNKLYYRK